MNRLNLIDKKILIVAPHPDDESIGMGGFLGKYGKQCDVLFVTDGRYGGKTKDDYLKTIKIRKSESNKAMNLVKVHNSFYLNIEDRHAYLNRKKFLHLK